MNECGKPATYVGTLKLSSANMSGQPGLRYNGPFCAGCTKTPEGWHRQFISDRDATPDEKCQVNPLPTI